MSFTRSPFTMRRFVLIAALAALLSVDALSQETNISNSVYGGQILGGPFPSLVVFTKRGISPQRNDYFCGGSLLSDQFVLTAAHCALTMKDNGGEDKVTAHGGVRTLHHLSGSSVQSSAIKSISVHPFYSGINMVDDIAIIELETPFSFTWALQPTTIYAEDAFSELPLGQNVWILGFGDATYNSPIPVNFDLNYASTPIVSRDSCRIDWAKYKKPISQNQICTSAQQRGLLKGDSGGPVIYSVKSSFENRQIGVVSYALPGNEALPDVSTRTAFYCTWIYETTRFSFACK